jgi:Uncharacterised protein family (UPF0172)
VTDAVPLFHLSVLAPMLEVASMLVDAHVSLQSGVTLVSNTLFYIFIIKGT